MIYTMSVFYSVYTIQFYSQFFIFLILLIIVKLLFNKNSSIPVM